MTKAGLITRLADELDHTEGSSPSTPSFFDFCGVRVRPFSPAHQANIEERLDGGRVVET